MSVLISMFIFILVGAISPGPVNIIAASTGARAGYKKAAAYILGATVSYTLVVIICGLSLKEVAHILPEITWLLKIFGGVFLLYMAYKIASSKGFDSTQGIDAPLPGFWDGALVQVLNPKAWLFAMSGVSIFIAGKASAELYLMFFCTMSFLVCFSGVSAWGALGSSISGLLSTPERQAAFNYAMGGLLGMAVFYMLLG
ncbi:LysE family translocator [Halodesulfovibrio spirochaetisodalis]|nr:LysE family translocator [Halodesulfovibrio spirochaetisodalis]